MNVNFVIKWRDSGSKHCDIYVHKGLTSRINMDLYFKIGVLEGDKVMEYCQFNEIDGHGGNKTEFTI